MKVKISLAKTLQENAAAYFDAAKKARRKLTGLEAAISEAEKKVAEGTENARSRQEKVHAKKRKREWYEKFRWFFTSTGMLVIAGRDAKSNEEAVKKQMSQEDLYFHADVHGAPHTILKTDGKEITPETKREAAQFAASFSSAWKSGVPFADVYCVKPEQVSKSAPSGESMGTGAMMIYGEREWFRKTKLELAIGLPDKGSSAVVISGPPPAIKKQTKIFVLVRQGSESKGVIAKKIKKILEHASGEGALADIDEIISMLPAGEFGIAK
ncbi:MAG: NFACT RNA binding domain-containing protein [Candidatus Diapherotrites archaeon]